MIFYAEELPDIWWQDGMRYVYDELTKTDLPISCAWGGSLSKSAIKLAELTGINNFQHRRDQCDVAFTEKKKVWFYAGGPFDEPLIHKFDLVFCEDKWSQNEFRKRGVDAKVAFGINTKVYYKIDIEGLSKIWDYIYPAALAGWKRHNLFVSKVTNEHARGLCVGQFIKEEEWIYKYCADMGITTMPKVTPDVVNWLYNQSKKAYFPAELFGGCQRGVWEAKYIGLDVEIAPDNPRLQEMLDTPVKTEKEYLDTVVKEIKKLCQLA